MYNHKGRVIIENKIKEYRQAMELTQQELAKKIGVSETHLQRIEYGKARPNIETALRLAHQLCTTVEDLFPLTVG